MSKIIDSYIKELNRNLLDLPDSDRQDVIDYYHEFLLDGDFQTEAAIVEDLGTPKILARKILADYAASISSQPDTKDQQSSGANLKTIWLIILGIFAAPIGIPLVVVIGALMIAIMIAFCIVVIGFAAVVAALIIGGFFILCKTFGLLWSAQWATGLFYLGSSLVAIVLGMILFTLIIKLIGFLVAECATFFRHIGRKVLKKHYFKTKVTAKEE